MLCQSASIVFKICEKIELDAKIFDVSSENFVKNYISKFYVDSFFSHSRTFHFFVANDRFLNHEKCFYLQSDSNILC